MTDWLRLKHQLFGLKYALISAVWRLRGLCIGRGCIISGFPKIFRHRGSQIRIGDHAVLHSKIKYNTLIRQPVQLSAIEPGARIDIGEHCGLSGCQIVCSQHVSIGRYTIIGPDTVIYDSKEHEFSPETGWLSRQRRTGKPIIIGEHCYIGMRCIILKGVHIGDRSVISAGSVITHDIPAGHLARGNPATCTPLPERLGGPPHAQSTL